MTRQANKVINQLGRAAPFWWRTLPLILIGLAGLLVYSNSFHGPFVFDDVESIRDNPTIRHLSPLRQVMFPEKGILGRGVTVEGRPLLNLSFALNYTLCGLEVWGYHAVNLLIHVLAGLTLFGIVRRTLLRLESSGRLNAGSASWLALLVALLWVVHPLQTESVTYMVQRAESLVGLFYLLTLYLSIRAMDAPWVRHWQIAAVFVCALGMMAKEVMVTAPMMILLYDSVFVTGSIRLAWRERWGFYLGLFATWAVLAAIMLWAGEASLGLVKALLFQASGQGTVAAAVREMNWLDYALTQFGAIVQYLRLSIWPDPLIFDYGNEVAHGFLETVPAALLVGLLFGATLVGLWRRHWTGFAGTWFFLILAPTSSVVPLTGQTMAEHRMYLPLAGVLVLLVAVGYAVWGKLQMRLKPNRWLSALAAASIFLVLGGLTLRRNRDYQSEYSIWQDTVLKKPTSPTAHNNLGYSTFIHEGRVDEAISHYQKALELSPNYADAHNNLAVALLDKGRVDDALTHFQKALELKPVFAEAMNNLGKVLFLKGQVDEAIVHFQKAVEMKLDFALAHNNLGAACLQKGQLDKALTYGQSAIEFSPANAEAHYNFGNALFQNGQLNEAVVQYQRALEIKSDYTGAHTNLGVALLKLGRVEEALLHYELAIKISPLDLGSINNLAWILATSPHASQRNGVRSLELAQRASELTGGNHPIVLHTLAAAFAECGRFAEAVRTADQALVVANAQGNTALADVIRKERDQYQAGKPVRENAPAAP
ncbi:MAG: tetratricopeptide repeat protein [Verrucomicrobia bacterium]|nr:tetratricopeptide repeat protein [Verrucomicrobiota bacterium]